MSEIPRINQWFNDNDCTNTEPQWAPFRGTIMEVKTYGKNVWNYL